MRKLKRIKNIIKQHKEELGKRFKVKEIGIFGSYVRGVEQRKSDVDVLVEFKEPATINCKLITCNLQLSAYKIENILKNL